MPLADLAPHDLTSNTSHPPFVVSASSQNSQAFRAFNIAGANPSGSWGDATTPTGWLQIDLGAAHSVTSYGILGATAGFNSTEWQLLGSPDGATWTVLDTQTGQTSWTNGVIAAYTPALTTAFRYFRFNILHNQSVSGAYVAELYLSATVLAQTITFPAIGAHLSTDAPFVIAATASSGLPVTYTVTGPATVSAGGTVTLLGAGSVTITASQAGDSTYAAATPVARTFLVSAPAPPAGPQTITFPVIPDHLATDPAFALGATASSGLPVTYVVTSGPATVLGGIVTLTGGSGSVTVTASQAGNSTWAAATPVSRTFNVNSPAGQTITFPAIADQLNTVGSFALGATASSGLAVTYVVTSGPASIFGATCILTGGLGPVTITAFQPGNATWAPAAPVSRTFNVLAPALVPQTITFPPLPDRLSGALFTLTATASSGLPVTYTISGPATLSGSIVTVTGTGAVTVTAFQAGDSTWSAAVPVARTFNVIALIQKIQRGNIAYDQIRALHRQGAGGQVQMYTGPAPQSGNVPVWDPNGSLVDSGVSAVSGASSSSGASVFGETPGGAIGGSNTVFTLAFVPLNGAVDLFLNGVTQRPAIDFALSGVTITYTVPPRTGDVHTASYRR